MYEHHPVVRQVYAAAAVLVFAASFVPLYEPKEPGDVYQTMTIWSAASNYGSGLAAFAILLAIVLCVTALVAAQPGRRGRRAPLIILVVALIGTLMLLNKAGEGSNPPSFGAGAGLLLGAHLVLLATSLVDLAVSVSREPWVEDPAGPPVPRIRWNP